MSNAGLQFRRKSWASLESGKILAGKAAPAISATTDCYKESKLQVLSGTTKPHCLTFTHNSLLICAGSDPDLLDQFLGRVVPAEVRICDIDQRSPEQQLDYVEHGLKVLYGAVMRSDCLDENVMRPLIDRAHQLDCAASLLFLHDGEQHSGSSAGLAYFEQLLAEAPSWLYQSDSWDGIIVLDPEAGSCIRGLLMV